MKHLITFVVGDRYQDGHGMVESTLIKSSHSYSEILSAIEIAKESMPFLRDLCSDYGDNKISNDKFLELEGLGISMGKFYPEDSHQTLDPDTYLDIYLGILEKSLPGFSYRRCLESEVCIGGYGLLQ